MMGLWWFKVAIVVTATSMGLSATMGLTAVTLTAAIGFLYAVTFFPLPTS